MTVLQEHKALVDAARMLISLWREVRKEGDAVADNKLWHAKMYVEKSDAQLFAE